MSQAELQAEAIRLVRLSTTQADQISVQESIINRLRSEAAQFA